MAEKRPREVLSVISNKLSGNSKPVSSFVYLPHGGAMIAI